MTAQAEERTSTPADTLLQPLPLSPFKVLTPTKATFEPLHLSPWCNQTRPTRPPGTTTPPRTRTRKAGSPSPECLFKSQPRMPGAFHWRTPSETNLSEANSEASPSKSTLNPGASEFVPKTYKPKPVHNPLGGKLALSAVSFFERAYGLNGQPRVEHTNLKEEIMTTTGCSERAVQAVLYGSSYNDLLDGLRAKVPGYTVQKDMTQDFTSLPFYHFDGNAQNVSASVVPSENPKTPTNYSTIALIALAAILPFTFLC